MTKPKRQLTVANSKGEAAAVLSTLGIEAICDLIIEGHSLTRIARDSGVGIATLINWIGADSERSARAKRARVQAAEQWDAAAEQGLRDANSLLELQRARELAHHYRWRATKIAPLLYGERVQVGGTEQLPPIAVTLSPGEAYIRLLKGVGQP